MYHHAKFNNKQVQISGTFSKLTGDEKKEIERDSRLNFETIITNQQFLPRQPTFMDATFSKHTFEDNNEWDVTSKIDRLVSSDFNGRIPYTQFDMGLTEPSAWVDYPRKYRFIGL